MLIEQCHHSTYCCQGSKWKPLQMKAVYLCAAPPSSTWATMIPWGERLDPRPPVIWIPSPSWPFTMCIFQIRLPSRGCGEEEEDIYPYGGTIRNVLRYITLNKSRSSCSAVLTFITVLKMLPILCCKNTYWSTPNRSFIKLENIIVYTILEYYPLFTVK